MKKEDKIKELETVLDHLIEQIAFNYNKNDIKVFPLLVEKQIIQAQLTALNWQFEKD